MASPSFSVIKKEYDGFYRDLLKNGRLPMWSTEKGFWNASISDEIYEAFKRLNLGRSNSFLDLGSGDGKVVFIASLFFKKAEGIEIDEFLHNKALQMQKKFGANTVKFHNKDFFTHKISGYDLIFMAPDAPFEKGVEDKLLKEMNGKLLHHGHIFHPSILKKKENFNINGNLFSIYSK